MAEVRVVELIKKFGDVVALHGETLTFDDTKLTVLVGPSGCGKTTLLRMIAGLEEPSDGSIYVGEKRVDAVPPWDRNIAMVFQSYALYPHMKVFKNIAFPLEAQKVPRQEIAERVTRTAEILGISELLDRTPRQLSGGQMQRVAIGRAIVRNPEVYLMDEPLSNLDAKLRVTMRVELKRLQKELGVTTIYVTHDQAEAMTMADKLVVMRSGRIQQVGPPDEVYLYPANIFVAGFIGSPAMNFIPCTYDDVSCMFTSGAFNYRSPERIREILSRHNVQNLILGIRPEDVKVHWEEQDCTIPATVYITEPLGKENLLTLKIEQHMVKASVPGRVSTKLDERVWLEFDPEAVHLFDGDTEMAIL
jgi:multiple sugar transport system ATP-binding protein